MSKCIISVAMLSSVLTVGLASVASAASNITEAATFPYSAEVSGGTTLPINLQHVGDLVIFQSQIHSQTLTVSSVSAPGTGTWTLAQRYVDATNGIITEEIWSAVATATGSSTITAVYSSSIGSASPELVADSFTTPTPSLWSVVSTGGAAAGTPTTTTAITFPSVTSNATANQVYWGYAESTQTATGGSTTGFTYALTGQLNLVTSNVNLGAGTPYAPTASESPAGYNTSIAAIFSAAPATNYTVTFNGNGNTGGSMTAEVANQPSALTTNTFTRTGYTFAGWATTSGGSVAYADGATYNFTANVTLYAQWTANTSYTVIFNGNTSTAGSMVNETANVPTALTANAFTKTGYHFAGWATTSGGSVAYADGATYNFTADVTLYAKWTANTAFTVTFNGNGNTGGSMTAQNTNTPTALTANAFTRTGYTFAGWATTSGGSVAYADGATYNFTANVTLYAQWTVYTPPPPPPPPTTYTVTFNANGGTGTVAPETNSASAALTANTFTRTGYTFAGWNTVAAGGGSAYVNNANYPFTASVTLYAQWTATNVPGAPSGLTATTGSGSASLVWSAPSGSTILGYNVYEGTSPGGESGTPLNGTTLVAGTSFVATGLNHGVRYYFIVKAVSANGSSIASSETSAISLTKASTHTSLTLSKRTVLYGSQHSVEFIVRVTPRGSNQGLSGVVKIKVGSRFVCTARVASNGTARCALPARALRVGSYVVVVMYVGNSNDGASNSAGVRLKIS